MEEREEIQVVIRKEILIRRFLYLLNNDHESDRDIPLVQAATQETEGLFLKKKQLHLISAIAFSIAAFLGLIGVVSSVNNIQLAFLCFALAFCVVNAVAQFVLFIKKR